MKAHHDYQLTVALLILGLVLLCVLAAGALVAVNYGDIFPTPTPRYYLQMT